MGMSLSHGDFRMSCGSFNVWRGAVAQAAGYQLIEHEMNNFGVTSKIKVPDLDYDNMPTDYYGKWEEEPEDILLVLLAHCDCEGVFKNAHLRPLSDRIQSLMEKIRTFETDPLGLTIMRTENFIEALEEAVEASEDLEIY
jgi:hypothetical protein